MESTQPKQKAAELKKDVPARTWWPWSTAYKGYSTMGNSGGGQRKLRRKLGQYARRIRTWGGARKQCSDIISPFVPVIFLNSSLHTCFQHPQINLFFLTPHAKFWLARITVCAQLQNQNTTNYREYVAAAGEVWVVRKPHFLIFAKEKQCLGIFHLDSFSPPHVRQSHKNS